MKTPVVVRALLTLTLGRPLVDLPRRRGPGSRTSPWMGGVGGLNGVEHRSGPGTGKSADTVPVSDKTDPVSLLRVLQDAEPSTHIRRVVAKPVEVRNAPLSNLVPSGVAWNPPGPGLPVPEGDEEPVPEVSVRPGGKVGPGTDSPKGVNAINHEPAVRDDNNAPKRALGRNGGSHELGPGHRLPVRREGAVGSEETAADTDDRSPSAPTETGVRGAGARSVRPDLGPTPNNMTVPRGP